MENNFKRNTIWNIIGTTINAFNSLFFLVVVKRVNGIFDAGIFTFGFSIAILLNIVGVYAGRIYQVTDNSSTTNKSYLINRIISCSIMILISIMFVLFKNYNLKKQLIIFFLCFLKMCEAFSDVLYGFSQRKDNLYKIGISLTVKSALGIIIFILIDILTKNLIISIISYTLVYIIITILYDFKQVGIKKITRESFDFKQVMSIFYKGFPTFCITFLTMYLINASKYAIDSQLSDNLQAVFGIVMMPATVMILIAQFIIHPFLMKIINLIKKGNYNDLLKIIFKLSLFIFVVGLGIVLLCYFVGIPILEIIYQISLSDYKMCLTLILIGAIFYAMTSVINTVLIAMRHTFIQMIVYMFFTVLTFVSANVFVKAFEVLGASLNYTLTMLLVFIAFLFIYLLIVKKEKKVANEK